MSFKHQLAALSGLFLAFVLGCGTKSTTPASVTGKIVYKGKPGPFGYHPEEVEAWLANRFPAQNAAR